MCKMAHFGNCDPETADQEYCIFHKPNKSEEEAREFYNKFVLRFFGYKLPWNEGWVFAKPVDASGFVFPEISKTTNSKTGEEFTFENAVFENMALFDKAIFEGKADFQNSMFNGSSKHRTSFKETIFDKTASFSGAYFKEVYFTKTLFRGPAYFENNVFEYFSFVDVIFNEMVRFDNALLGVGKLYLINTTRVQFFKPALLQGEEYYKRKFNATFMKSVSFKHVFSSVIVDFSGSKFYGSVTYDNSNFVYGIECHYCEFNDITTGYSSKFQTYIPRIILKLGMKDPFPYFDTLSTTFAHSTFRETVHFDSAEFGKVIFNFAVFEKGASFKNSIFYDQAQFRETKFREPVEFHDAIFIGDAKFESTFFESIAGFVEAIFLQESDFTGAVFNNKANFRKAFFNGDVIFKDAAFRLSADFSGKHEENKIKKILEEISNKNRLPRIEVHIKYKFGGKVDFSHTSVTALKLISVGDGEHNGRYR